MASNAMDFIIRFRDEASAGLRGVNESLRRTRSSMDDLTDSSGNYRDANGRLRNANGAFIRDTDRSARSTKGFGASLKALGPMAAAAGAALGAIGMAGFAKDVMAVGMEFDAAISEVSALSGAAGDDLQSIRDKAKEIGSTTSLSASEAASAFKYMSLAGWDAEQMLGAVDGVAQLAIASGEDLGAVADIVTD